MRRESTYFLVVKQFKKCYNLLCIIGCGGPIYKNDILFDILDERKL